MREIIFMTRTNNLSHRDSNKMYPSNVHSNDLYLSIMSHFLFDWFKSLNTREATIHHNAQKMNNKSKNEMSCTHNHRQYGFSAMNYERDQMHHCTSRLWSLKWATQDTCMNTKPISVWGHKSSPCTQHNRKQMTSCHLPPSLFLNVLC